MPFSTQKKKLENAFYNAEENEVQQIRQQEEKALQSKEHKDSVSTIQVFKVSNDLSIDWQDLLLFEPLTEGSSFGYYQVWSYEINNMPELWIPYINVRVLFRNKFTLENYIYLYPHLFYLLEVADLEGSPNKKVTIHASFNVSSEYSSSWNPANVQAKLQIYLRNPSEYL